MSTGIDLSTPVPIPGAAGVTPGYFVPESLYRALVAERDRLNEECSRLRAEKAEIAGERDVYLASLHALTWKEFTFDAEEIARMQQEGLTLQQAIEQLGLTAKAGT